MLTAELHSAVAVAAMWRALVHKIKVHTGLPTPRSAPSGHPTHPTIQNVVDIAGLANYRDEQFCRAARAWSHRLRLENAARDVRVSDRAKSAAKQADGEVKINMSGRSCAAGAGCELCCTMTCP